MRLWTIHPRYLDAQGLVALWREALLAKKVLEGGTRGYRHHPQLARFRKMPHPDAAISAYLAAIHEESVRRGYRFDASKIGSFAERVLIEETEGQLLHEWEILKGKLAGRSPELLAEHRHMDSPDPHPLFFIVPGPVREGRGFSIKPG